MFNKLGLSLAGVALALSGAFAIAEEGGGKAQFADVSHQEMVKAVESKSATIIDVNGSESYKEGHIPGSIDYEANKDKLAALLPADKKALIVAYCGSPKCNAYRAAANAAVKLGYTNVKHYSGGISGWKESGAKVEKAS